MFAVETRKNKNREWETKTFHHTVESAWQEAEAVAKNMGLNVRVVNERGAEMERPKSV